MNDSFDHARANAKSDCPSCQGTGMFQYTSHGTPGFTICRRCCKHDRGFWQLKEHYREDNGKWCCLAGCGLKLTFNPDAFKKDYEEMCHESLCNN